MASSSQAPPIINVHTPTASWSIIHSLNEESLTALFDKLTRKATAEYRGSRVGPSWLKYEWNQGVWDLSDDSDYTIWNWRLKSPDSGESAAPPPSPTLYLHAPEAPLPGANGYRNPLYYLFRQPTGSARDGVSVRSGKAKSKRSGTSRRGSPAAGADGDSDSAPAHVRDFKRFHSENGVRTVIGTIGPVPNVRMLLKSSHRHVYISRKFAVRHGFVPRDALPGHYGYGGLVNIGKWPISLGRTTDNPTVLPKAITVSVYLSEEPHFDVILGRSFHEARRIRTDPLDPTDVRCMDTNEKVECEVVVLRDGRGEIVTVT